MLDTHVNAAPESAYVSTVQLPLHSLDTGGAEYVHPDSRIFIKADTQGYEPQVLEGLPSY